MTEIKELDNLFNELMGKCDPVQQEIVKKASDNISKGKTIEENLSLLNKELEKIKDAYGIKTDIK